MLVLPGPVKILAPIGGELSVLANVEQKIDEKREVKGYEKQAGNSEFVSTTMEEHVRILPVEILVVSDEQIFSDHTVVVWRRDG